MVVRKEKKSLAQRLGELDIKIVTIFIFILIIIPIVYPIGLPIIISNTTKELMSQIDEVTQPGNVGAWNLDQEPQIPGTVPFAGQSIWWKDILRRPDVKIVIFGTTMPESIQTFKQLKEYYGFFGKEYGKDIVFLGYLPGGDISLAALATDVWSAAGGIDYEGTPLTNLPLMANVRSIADFDFLISSGTPGGSHYEVMRQWAGPYHIKTFIYAQSWAVSLMVPYIEAGVLTNMIRGELALAEYELYINEPGAAISSMDSQTLGHLGMLFLFFLGNLSYFLVEKEKRRSLIR